MQLETLQSQETAVRLEFKCFRIVVIHLIVDTC